MHRVRTWSPAGTKDAIPFGSIALLAFAAGCSAGPRVHGQGLPAAPTTQSAPATTGSAPARQPAKNYWIPAVEIVGFQIVLNQFDRQFADEDEYDTDLSTIRANLESAWVMDSDPFAVNQLGHPYSGSIYHGFARSAGLDYWESFAYTFVASALWEVAGETTQPSLNDQITTGIGGSFLGEAFFRGASWLLGAPGSDRSVASTVGATLLSPPTAFNRWVFPGWFPTFASHEPEVVMRLGLGVTTDTFLSDRGRSNTEERTDALFDFSMEYGLPGRQGYRHERPFDYFRLELGLLTASKNHVDHLLARGLIFGEGYGSPSDLCGIWGMYGSYDYLSPGVFRLASTALSVGTTAQVRLGGEWALQGTCLGGVGFGAAGTVADALEDRDYHYGAIPQVVLDMRLVVSDRAMLDLVARDYFVIGVGSDDDAGSENILQASLGCTVRVLGGHALRAEYVASARDTHFSSEPDVKQSVGSFYVTWSWFGGTRFRPVE